MEIRTPSQTREKAPRTRPTPKPTCFPKNAKERVLDPSTLRYGPVLNLARPPNPDSPLRAEKGRKNGHPPRRARRPPGRVRPRNRHVSQKSRKVLSKRILAWLRACFKPRAASDGQIHFFGGIVLRRLHVRAKKIRPGHGRMKWAKKSPQRPTFPPTGSIIGDGELNFRVRNGIGWILPSMATGKINKLNQEKGPGIGNDNKAKPHDLLVLLG